MVYVKQCLTYKMFLNEDETEMLRDICKDALLSDDEVVQFTASQIAGKAFSRASCKLKIPEGMVNRYNLMIQTTAPDLFSLLGIKERKQ